MPEESNNYRCKPVPHGSAVPAGVTHFAHKVMATLNECPLYARVDVIEDENGQYVLGELELLEPDLFMDPYGHEVHTFVAEILAQAQVKKRVMNSQKLCVGK
jgi:hypothetical protein